MCTSNYDRGRELIRVEPSCVNVSLCVCVCECVNVYVAFERTTAANVFEPVRTHRFTRTTEGKRHFNHCHVLMK